MRVRRLGGAVMVLVLAACSGSGGDGDSGLPKDEFIAQSDAICAKHAQTQSEIFASIPATANAEDTAAIYLARGIPDRRAQIEELRRLPAPENDRDAIDKLYDDIAAVTAQLERDLKDDPQAALTDENPYADVNTRMKNYGFTTCAE